MLTVQVVSQKNKRDYSKRHAWFFVWEICCENWKASSQCSFFSTRDSQVTKCLQKNRKGPYRENGKDDGSGDFRHFDGSGVLFLK